METIEIVDNNHYYRRVSLDINVSHLKKIQQASNYFPRQDYLEIPITIFPKGLLIDLNICSGSGKGLSLLDSDELASAGQSLIKATVTACNKDLHEDAYKFEEIIKELGINSPFSQLQPLSVKEILKLPPFEAMEQAAQAGWRRALSEENLLSHVNTLRESFITLCRVSASSPPDIIKYAWTENEPNLNAIGNYMRRRAPEGEQSPGAEGEQSPGSEGGFKKVFSVSCRDVGRSAREHLRIVAPSGVLMGETILLPHVSPNNESQQLEYVRRNSLEQTIFYSRKHPPAQSFAVGLIWPDLENFKLPAYLLTIISSVILLLGGVTELVASFHLPSWVVSLPFMGDIAVEAPDVLSRIANPNYSLTGAAFTLLVLLPSILVAYVIREGEHSLRKTLLLRVRTLVILSLAPLLVSAVLLILPIIPTVLGISWIIMGFWCLITVFLLRRNFKRILNEMETARREGPLLELFKFSVIYKQTPSHCKNKES